MIKHQVEEKVYLKRIESFIERLKNQRIKDSLVIPTLMAHCKDAVPFGSHLELEYTPVNEGQVWGEAWDSAWFLLQFEVPQHWDGDIALELDINAEGLLFDDKGNALQGISNNSVYVVDGRREIARLPNAKAGDSVKLWLEGGAYSLCGIDLNPDPEDKMPRRYGSYRGEIKKLRAINWDQEVWSLYLDMEVALDLANSLDSNSVRRSRLILALNDAINLYAENPKNTAAARELLGKTFDQPANASDMTAYAVGHAHLDTAWLWPVKETVRKSARSFSTQLALMDRYPDYVFGASQPQHYEFIKEYYPDLFSKIKQQVKEGRWECQGGMWIEADCNLISGESMVRQFLYGKHYYLDEFDVDVNHLWLPDVFGYSAALPQIMTKSGCDYFITQKISWNQFNEFPYNSFIWQGIDGSSVLSHFPPENDYNCSLKPSSLNAGQARFKEKAVAESYLSLYGIGNGGGGPTEEQIERGLRQKNLEGAPKVKLTTAENYLQSLEAQRDRLPHWQGELYLEMHRGTYTSQAKVKLRNRQLENKLRSLEILASQLPIASYPQQELDALWKVVMLNQFHDIIPGSSINEVYKVTHKQLDDAWDKVNGLIQDMGKLLLTQNHQGISLYNSLTCEFLGWVELDGKYQNSLFVDHLGQEYSVIVQGTKTGIWLSMPALSWLTLELKGKDQSKQRETNQAPLLLENAVIRYQFDQQGQLISAWDKEACRELISTPANALNLFLDRPNSWDAWDVDQFYQDQWMAQADCISVKRVETQTGSPSLELKYQVSNSSIKQIVSLSPFSKRLDFHTQVAWQEKHRMLRVTFPLELAGAKANFDIQFGYTQRANHSNTSWESAQFEVCAHKFADLSEANYGVAVLNDCKYGYKVDGNVIELNLLRSPNYPDPDCDIGDHEFTYSLLPHCDALHQSDVQQQAWSLNVQPEIFEGLCQVKSDFTVEIDSDCAQISAIKKAHKTNQRIVRVVEEKGTMSSVALNFNQVVDIDECNLIETETIAGSERKTVTSTSFTLKPFEIRTFRVTTLDS